MSGPRLNPGRSGADKAGMSAISRQRSRLRAVLALCLGGATLLPWPAAALAPGMPLAAAVPELRAAAPGVRRVFVESAVAALAGRYRRAAREAADNDAWAEHTRAYVRTLEQAAAAARAGGSVTLLRDPDASVRVIVGTRPSRQFTLAAPRPREQAALEREVLAALCARLACEHVRAAPRPRKATGAAAAASPAPRQTLAAHLPRGADDGLSCGGAVRHARLHARACERLGAELRALAQGLHRAALAGQPIDWAVIEGARWRVRGRELEVAADGAAVTIEAPLLARYPRVLAAAVPWLRARLAGKVREQSLELPAGLVYAAGSMAAASES